MFNINFKVALNKQEYLKNSLCYMKSQEVSISTSPSKGEKCSSLHFEMVAFYTCVHLCPF